MDMPYGPLREKQRVEAQEAYHLRSPVKLGYSGKDILLI
jgi:hypothetical protein